MKIKKLDAHDRLLEFEKQSDLISEGCADCIKNRPVEFGNHPFYIFAHQREISIDERVAMLNQDIYECLVNPLYMRRYVSLKDVPTARLIWAPRLTKPAAQTNSMLFKAYPPSDNIKVIWIIPPRELWAQYRKGNLTENQVVHQSIESFDSNRSELEAKEPDDVPEKKADQIYRQIALNKSKGKKII
jgi:hypothetical protein